MTVSIAVVMSLDAQLTRHTETNIRAWASKEDQTHFQSLIASHEVIIMGRRTYEAARPALRFDIPVKRIVLTKRPDDFASQTIQDKLEFRTTMPSVLVEELKQQGTAKILVVGGPDIMTELLQRRAVDSIFMTIEPLLFGQGIPFLRGEELDAKLQLVSFKQLNKQGTLLLQYKLLHD